MTLQWGTTNTAGREHGVKVLVFAEAGAGKTVLCATAPRPVILSAESGLLSLQRANLERMHGVNAPGITYDIPVLQITTYDQMLEAYQFMREPEARQHFDTICVDSLSEIAEQILSNAKRTIKDGRQAYGELADQTVSLVRQFRDLPGYHIYMSAKLGHEQDASGITRGTVSMPGRRLPEEIPYLFDEMFRLGIGEHEGNRFRFLQTDGDLKYVCKDRSGTLDFMEPPNLSHIFNKILGGSQ